MKILIMNATILPMTAEDLVLHGAIAIEGRNIVAVGSIPAGFVADKVIDAQGLLALPGFVNAHTHVSMTFFRNYKDSVQDLHDWLEEIWRLERLLVPEDTYPASLLGIAEMIASGTTCFADMYFFPEGTVDAAIEAGIKANIGLTLFGDEADSRSRIDERLPYLRTLRERTGGSIRFDIAPHAVYTCTPGTYRLAAQTAKTEGCKVHSHASETAKEVSDCMASYGKTPIAHMHDSGVLAAGTYLAHAVHPQPSDVRLLAKHQAVIVHNPSSNCKLGSGIAPLSAYRDAGVRLALGTDGASSNNALDMFQELRLAAMLSAGSTGNPMAMSPFELLRMATIGGAVALGREHECGTLETGKDADIILLDAHAPHMTPLNNPYSAIIFAAKSTDVRTVLCAGKILMEDRKFTTIDIEATQRRFLETWNNIQARS